MATVGPFNFRGGFCPGYGFASLPQGMGYATDMKNCRFKSGAIVPRWAQSIVNNATLGAAKYVTGLTTWFDAPNNKQTIVAICNAKIHSADLSIGPYFPPATLAFSDLTGAVALSGLSSFRYSFDSLNGMLIGVGASAVGIVPFKFTAYNVNAAVLGGTPPNGDAVKQVNNFLFISRQLASSTTWSRVSWSAIGDPETWPAANFVDMSKADGEPIMALGSIGTDLYIFKQTSIARLSTYTQIISGAVALGPLQIIIKGNGCAGPLAIDNLPNGNLVFLGYDGQLYEFDGSSPPVNLSRTPYPGPNAFTNMDQNSIGGLSVGTVNARALVKVWPGIDEVWVGFDLLTDQTPAQFRAFAFNYVERIWEGYISDMLPASFASYNIGAIASTAFEGNAIFFDGNDNGEVFARGYLSKQYPVDEDNVAVDFRVGTTIHLGKEGLDFIPRSLCIELSNTSARLADLSVYITFDSYHSSGTAAYSSGVGPLPTRIFIPINILPDSVGSNVIPKFITIELIGSGTGSSSTEAIRINDFYLSDEVIR